MMHGHRQVVSRVLKELVDKSIMQREVENVRDNVSQLRLIARAEKRDLWQCHEGSGTGK